jgi:hypothetical protein
VGALLLYLVLGPDLLFNSSILSTFHIYLPLDTFMLHAMSVPTPCAINKLPPEILSVIVEDTCAGDASEIILPVPQYELPCPILCLSQVSRLWRNISHGRKNLWTHYIIDIDPYATPDKLSDLLALLSICIQNSGTRELLFQFTDNNDVGGDVLVELLTAYSRRITTLSLSLDAHGATTLLNRPTLPFDRLHTLFVLEKPLFRAAGTLWDGADPDTVSAFFADAPQLTDFRVEDSIWHPLNSPGLVLHTWGIPLARLTVIHVTHVWLASDECVVIFRGCPQVREPSVVVSAVLCG